LRWARAASRRADVTLANRPDFARVAFFLQKKKNQTVSLLLQKKKKKKKRGEWLQIEKKKKKARLISNQSAYTYK